MARPPGIGCVVFHERAPDHPAGQEFLGQNRQGDTAPGGVTATGREGGTAAHHERAETRAEILYAEGARACST